MGDLRFLEVPKEQCHFLWEMPHFTAVWRKDPDTNQIPERYHKAETHPDKNTFREKYFVYIVRPLIPLRTRD